MAENWVLALRQHAKIRIRERYGIEVKTLDLRKINDTVRRGEGVFVKRISERRSLHRVQFKDVWLNVVWDKDADTICTALPQDAPQFKAAQKSLPTPTTKPLQIYFSKLAALKKAFPALRWVYCGACRRYRIQLFHFYCNCRSHELRGRDIINLWEKKNHAA